MNITLESTRNIMIIGRIAINRDEEYEILEHNSSYQLNIQANGSI